MRFVILIAIMVVGAATLLWSQAVDDPLIVSGTIESDEIRVGSRVGGRVSEALVEEGQSVRKGDTLVRFEPFDLRERLAEAKLELAARTANHQRLHSGFRTEEVAEVAALRDQRQAALDLAVAGPRPQEIRQARDELRQAEADLRLAQQTHQRTERLFGRMAASKEDLDEQTARLQVAQSRVEVQSARLALLEEGFRKEEIDQARAALEQTQARLTLMQKGYRQEEIDEARARMEAAAAAVSVIERQLEELIVVAPADCVVEAVDLREGDLVSPNAPVLSLLDLKRLWVRSYVPGRFLHLVRPGADLTVVVDGFPDRPFRGKVVFLSQEGEFTPSNVQTPEERGKRVFRIKVELEGETRMLRPGMSADVHLGKDNPLGD